MIKLEARKAQRRAAPDLTPSRPRPVTFTAAGWAVTILAALLTASSLASGVGISYVAVRNRDLRRSLERAGVRTLAVVTRLNRSGGDHPRYNVYYRYPVGGGVFDDRGSIRRSEWTALRVGSEVTVLYLASRPAQSWILGYGPRQVPFWVGPAVTVALAFFAWIAWRELRKQWMLLSEGRPAEARVVGSKKSRHSHKSTSYAVRYEFALMNGATRTGKYDTQKKPPETGTTLRIVYDPDDPERSSPYPLSLVRVS